MINWSFTFVAIAAASSTSSSVSAFNSPQHSNQQQRQQNTRHIVFAKSSEEIPKAAAAAITTTSVSSLTLEEELVSKLVTTADQHFGKKKRNAYRTMLENIRDSKSRSQRLLARSALDKQYAEEKLAKMMAKYQAQKEQIESELEAKTMEAQKIVDEEVQSIMGNLQSKIDSEIMRESQVRSLVDVIETAIANKESELAAEEVITGDMMKVRAKVKKGAIANQIDDLLEQKARVAAMDRKLVLDLQDLIGELNEMLERTKVRAVSLGSALARIERSGTHTWSSNDDVMMKQMEEIFTVAVEETETWEKTLLVVRDWVHEAVWSKSQVLNEPLPQSMEAVGHKKRSDWAKEEEIKKQLKHLDFSAIAVDGDGKIVSMAQEGEIGTLGVAAGKFALAGGKTAMFGLKSLIDSSSGLAKGPTTNAIDNLKEMIQSQLSKDTKSTTSDNTLGDDGVVGDIVGKQSPIDQSSSRQGWNAAAVLQIITKKNKTSKDNTIDNLEP